jgi:hypothetical protein
VSRGDNERHSVEHGAEQGDLTGQTRKRVSIALDLESRQLPIHHGDICTTLSVEYTKFLDDDRFGLSRVPDSEFGEQSSPNVSVMGLHGQHLAGRHVPSGAMSSDGELRLRQVIVKAKALRTTKRTAGRRIDVTTTCTWRAGLW